MKTRLITASLSTVFFIRIDATDDCTLYLAPSSTHREDTDETILGIYAGVNYEPGTLIGPAELAIPIFDIHLHNGIFTSEDPTESQTYSENSEIFDPFLRWMWLPSIVGAQFETYYHSPNSEIDETIQERSNLVSIPGVASLLRENPSIHHANFNESVVLRRTLSVDEIETEGLSHPGRGAYTNYYDVTLQASSFIPTGMEIFSNLSAEKRQSPVVHPSHYSDADVALTKMNQFFSKYQNTFTQAQQQLLYDFIVRNVFPYAGTETKQSSSRKDVVEEIFPKDAQEIKQVLDIGGTYAFQHRHVMKSKAWLDDNGQCLDGLYPGKSTIENAGRGAFSRRIIREGDVIAPMPLLVIENKDWLNMRWLEHITEEDGVPYAVRDTEDDRIIHQQLTLNYCFGHKESSLLFCPVGAAVNYINHKKEGHVANSKIVWSDRKYYKNDLLNLTMDHVAMCSEYCLGFDLIATKNIRPGEEIFLDYGSEWESAWMTHISSWIRDEDWPRKASDMNQKVETTYFYTVGERKELLESHGEDPYPEEIDTVCQLCWTVQEDGDDATIRFDSSKDISTLWTSEFMYVCEIVTRDLLEENYDGLASSYTYSVLVQDGDETITVSHVPHNVIRFHDKPYTSDIHESGTFRHSIGIPDEMFPELWRDLKPY